MDLDKNDYQLEFDDDFLLNLTAFSAADNQNQNLMPASSDSCFSLEVPSNNELLPIDDDRDGELGVGFKVVFRTKSDIDVMDDGFRWRKYGKKKVKNSPNPRNYYRCSTGGCNVKKRVERESEDPSYVITTYEGRHNHESPAGAISSINPQSHKLQLR